MGASIESSVLLRWWGLAGALRVGKPELPQGPYDLRSPGAGSQALTETFSPGARGRSAASSVSSVTWRASFNLPFPHRSRHKHRSLHGLLQTVHFLLESFWQSPVGFPLKSEDLSPLLGVYYFIVRYFPLILIISGLRVRT